MHGQSLRGGSWEEAVRRGPVHGGAKMGVRQGALQPGTEGRRDTPWRKWEGPRDGCGLEALSSGGTPAGEDVVEMQVALQCGRSRLARQGEQGCARGPGTHVTVTVG